MKNRQEAERLEERELSSVASISSKTRGRVHREDEHPYRTVYTRDRDRIIHCSAFRRLEYKTQVFLYNEGDYYRTRLTHTLEVAQIARSIARALWLNEDLTEAIALSHDMGHPPFGHSGEQALDELMSGSGGFEHNHHTLRIVDHIERRYPDFRGLNLSWETREAIAKHSGKQDDPLLEEFAAFSHPSLEAQIVDMADSIAYSSHDLDDGLTSGVIKEEDLENIALWRKATYLIKKKVSITRNVAIYQVIRRIIDSQVGDMIRQTENNLKRFSVDSADQVRAAPQRLADFSVDLRREQKELKDFLREKMYRHHRVIRMEEKAGGVIRDLFKAYKRRPGMMPANVYSQIDNVEKDRLICDYIAGMTDRFALEEHNKLFDSLSRV